MASLSKKKLVSGVFLLCLFFLVFNFLASEAVLRNFFYKISYPAQKSLWDSSQAAVSFSRSYLNSYQLGQENKKLASENRELTAKLSELDALAGENDVLRQALSLELKNKFVLSPCQLVSKDLAGDIITINFGKNQGAAVGQTVVSREGILIGRIEDVYDDFSRVIFISHTKSVTDVEFQEKKFYALAKGQGNLNISLDLVSNDKDVKEGDLLVTSVLGGVFPSGIPFGRVSSVQKQAAASFLQIRVKPLFELESLNQVFVIKNFKPLK